jgi:hypothetical protein
MQVEALVTFLAMKKVTGKSPSGPGEATLRNSPALKDSYI